MILTSFTLVLSLTTPTFVIPAPAPHSSAPSCKPNFQGRAQTIFKRPPTTDTGIYEWQLAYPPTPAWWAPIPPVSAHVNHAFAVDEFIIEFNAESINTYNFK